MYTDFNCNACFDCGGCTRGGSSNHQLCSRCSCSRSSRKLLLLPVFALLLLQACASIADSGPDFVPVRSTPAGAAVTVDGIGQGKTPCIVAIQRKAPGALLFELDGYSPITVQRDKVTNGWILGNFFIDFCTISLLIDIASGNSTRHSHDEVNVVLRKPGEGSSELVVPKPPPEQSRPRR